MVRQLVVALTGRMRSGKDEVAAHLERVHGFERASVSAPLKAAVGLLFELDAGQLHGDRKDEPDALRLGGATPRRLLQAVGTDLLQRELPKLVPAIDATYWFARLVREIREARGARVVVTDVRFLHEERLLREAFGSRGLLWRVHRPDSTEFKDSSAAFHASELEHACMRPDAVLVNDACLSVLRSRVDSELRKLDARVGL